MLSQEYSPFMIQYLPIFQFCWNSRRPTVVVYLSHSA